MLFEEIKSYFESQGLGDRVKDLSQSSATVEEAAKAVGTEPKQIAKTLSFLIDGEPILVVAAGDAKVDNHKFRAEFNHKAKMIHADEVEGYVGHAPGGVCPFCIKPNVKVYLDVSLRRFDIVYPAAGTAHSAIKLTPDELAVHSKSLKWVDVCSHWE
ncbi:MAG: YbaK/EbsC family protein [Veillonella sp.]|uniref:YbaK/EbsC family protein n=1 Tax=Veillonella sp. TaxID=1926307 RepID=UPI0025E94B94|nr:YbaK/EbsC family protein [Veillonella sp.]MBS4914078.1 YbaK/EbsC family protein [Veillonella sp.]